jgi:hypothetical protein
MLSFTGAPAPFPVRADDRHLQKYLQWSENIASAASAFIDTHLNGGSDSGFIGISLRNDLDWVNGFLKKISECMLFTGERVQIYTRRTRPPVVRVAAMFG